MGRPLEALLASEKAKIALEQQASINAPKVVHYDRVVARTMSSREIATLCEKEHRHVLRDIRKMLDELDIYAPDFSGTFITEQLEIDALRFERIYLDSMNLTLSMANFHSSKLRRPPIPMNKMGKHTVNFV